MTTTTTAWMTALHGVRNAPAASLSEGQVSREILNLVSTFDEFGDIGVPIDRVARMGDWIYPSLEEIRDTMFAKKRIPTFDYTYGARIFRFAETIDQLDGYVIPLLAQDKSSRRAVITIWDPARDARLARKNLPGVVSFDFKIRDGKVHTTVVLRSCNLLFGWPANAYQAYLLSMHICEKLQVKMGSITLFMTSAHVFEDEMASVDRLCPDA